MGIYKRRSRNSPRKPATTAAKNAFRLPSEKAYSLIALNVEKDVQVHTYSVSNPLEVKNNAEVT